MVPICPNVVIKFFVHGIEVGHIHSTVLCLSSAHDKPHAAYWGLLNEFHCVTFGALVVSLYFKTGNYGRYGATFYRMVLSL